MFANVIPHATETDCEGINNMYYWTGHGMKGRGTFGKTIYFHWGKVPSF
jgi:hypothetical protein